MQNPTLPYLTVGTFLHSYSFQVPSYQRWYDWEERQWEDLWNDIQGILPNPASYHVLGLATAHQRHGLHELISVEQVVTFEVDIVDGQQRIITLLILLSVIYRHLGSQNMMPAGAAMEDLRRILHPRYHNLGPIPRLTLNDVNLADYFSRFIIDNPALLELATSVEAREHSRETLSHERLFMAALHFIARVQNFDGDLLVLTHCIINRLRIAVNTYGANADPTLVFSIVNDRGKPLTELEKFKNILIHLIHKQLTTEAAAVMPEQWSPVLIQDGLSDAYGLIMRILATSDSQGRHPIDEDRFLRDLWIICSNSAENIVESANDYRALISRMVAEGRRREAQVMVTDLVEFGLKLGITAYRDIYFPDLEASFAIVPNEWKSAVRRWIKRFHYMGHFTTAIPLLMAAYIRAAITPEQPPQMLWETFLYVLGRYESYLFYRKIIKNCEPPQRRPYPSHEIARKILHGALEQDSFNEDFKPLYRQCDIDVETVLGEKSENNIDRFKYIFYEYEVALRGGEDAFENMPNFEELSLEHILPQTLNSNAWSLHEDDHDAYKNNIGNLCILERGLNTSISNRCLSYKIQNGYSRSDLRGQFDELNNVFFGDERIWNTEKISRRLLFLLNWIESRWNLILIDRNAQATCFYHRYLKKAPRCLVTCEVRQNITFTHPSDLREFTQLAIEMRRRYSTTPAQCKQKILEYYKTNYQPNQTLRDSFEHVREMLKREFRENAARTRSQHVMEIDEPTDANPTIPQSNLSYGYQITSALNQQGQSSTSSTYPMPHHQEKYEELCNHISVLERELLNATDDDEKRRLRDILDDLVAEKLQIDDAN